MKNIFKKPKSDSKICDLIRKYHIPKEYISINRRSITKGIFWGLFFGFIPMPFQMLAVLALTPFMKFNVPIAMTMVWLSNPLTMPFMYYMEYQTGNFLLDLPPLPDLKLTLAWFQENLSDIVLPLYVGTIPYSLFVSGGVYLIVNFLWVRSIKKDKAKKRG
jgi:uncharacterized protein (DUF2062 family)